MDDEADRAALRVCVVYDCLYPQTVGGAERWYRALAEHLAARGHEVTYLTLRQWERGSPPVVPGVRVVAVGPRLPLYTRGGRRRVLPPLLAGLGVLAHLARHRGRYDVVHTASFPYFPLLGAALVGVPLVVDWHELWSPGYWRAYLGRAGVLGQAVQAACLRVPQQAVCFSALTAGRLTAAGLRPVLLRGLADPTAGGPPLPARQPPEVVWAGRWVREKRLPDLVAAVALARRDVPGLRLRLLGDGPARPEVEAAVAAAGLRDAVVLPGRVAPQEVGAALAGAAVVAVASEREGYGLLAVEALSRGTPVVAAAGPDTAVPELVEPGRNGSVVPVGDPAALAGALVQVVRAGPALRASTAAWWAEHGPGLALPGSVAAVERCYASARR